METVLQLFPVQQTDHLSQNKKAGPAEYQLFRRSAKNLLFIYFPVLNILCSTVLRTVDAVKAHLTRFSFRIAGT